jgi:adenine-specific DNA-methyltransferase
MKTLPASGPIREALREKGQFWTPDWVADAMVSYVLGDGAKSLFDPAVGAGAFFSAARRIKKGLQLTDLHGSELHEAALTEARQNGLSEGDLADVVLGDFLERRFGRKFPAIVANPPYIRHHRLSSELKERLRHYAIKRIGFALDGRAGLHIYFLLRALELLETGGRLAFIVPADICEGIFARPLWNWIIAHYRVDAAINFASEATPFPGVDTNPLILCLSNNPPQTHFTWSRVLKSAPDEFINWFANGFPQSAPNDVACIRREVSEAVATGLSRPPFSTQADGCRLGDFARVMRGIATGDNDFFLFTNERRKEFGLEKRWFVRVVGRTRDCPSSILDGQVLEELDTKSRPTWLLNLDATPMDSLPVTLRDYLRKGEQIGLPERPLISTRKPWFKTEQREVPPILFSYLGRRNSRFILNTAGILPLTGFLCVYPHSHRIRDAELLWRALNHPATLEHLRFVGKSYGDDAIKVEPRSLEDLIIPNLVLGEFNIEKPETPKQLALLEQAKASKNGRKQNGESVSYRRRKKRY